MNAKTKFSNRTLLILALPVVAVLFFSFYKLTYSEFFVPAASVPFYEATKEIKLLRKNNAKFQVFFDKEIKLSDQNRVYAQMIADPDNLELKPTPRRHIKSAVWSNHSAAIFASEELARILYDISSFDYFLRVPQQAEQPAFWLLLYTPRDVSIENLSQTGDSFPTP